MEKICLQCGITFVPKKSNGVYCSTKCRNRANYKNKCVEKQAVIVSNSMGQAKFELDSNDKDTIVKTINKLSLQIDEHILKRTALIADNTNLLIKIEQIETKKISIQRDNITPRQAILNLSNSEIYNQYLNSYYLDAIKRESNNAWLFFRGEQEFETHYLGDKTPLNMVLNYRQQLETELQTQEENIEVHTSEITQINLRLTNNNNEIKSIKEDLRFLESRLSRYDNSLINV